MWNPKKAELIEPEDGSVLARSRGGVGDGRRGGNYELSVNNSP